MDTKYLVCIQIESNEKVWNRCVIASYVPHIDDLQFYYHTLCGIEGTITSHHECIPNTFNEELLRGIQTISGSMPRNDLETDIQDIHRREKYKKLIQNICELERGRFHLFQPKQEKNTVVQEPTEVPKKRNWAKELLHSLEGENEDLTEAIMPSSQEDMKIFGWILTPSSPYVKETQGSRFLLNMEIGKKWEILLGTDIYPDLLVRRRISMQGWLFQQPISEILLQSMVDWYVLAKDTKVEDGLTGWIKDADVEFTSLLTSVCRIKVHENVMKVTEDTSQVTKILSIIESNYLGASTDVLTIHPISADDYKRYMNYVFLYLRIPKEQYWGLEKTNKVYARWEQSQLGFLPDKNPYIANWSETWNVIASGVPVSERMKLFLQTLDAWDSIESVMINSQQKTKLAKEWIKLYMKNEIIIDKSSSVRSPILHEKVKKWCYKFLPEALFETKLSPIVIGPVFTKQGFLTKKRKGGRWTNGFVFREEPALTRNVEETRADVEQEEENRNEIHLGLV